MSDDRSPDAYPRQQLGHQEVQPGRSHTWVYLAVGIALALVVGGVAGWLLLRGDGEDQRAEYCAALGELSNGGDLMSAVGGADSSTLGRVDAVTKVAPDAVAADWQTLSDLMDSVQQSSEPTPTSLLAAYSALQSIARDADAQCGLTIEIPGF